MKARRVGERCGARGLLLASRREAAEPRAALPGPRSLGALTPGVKTRYKAGPPSSILVRTPRIVVRSRIVFVGAERYDPPSNQEESNAIPDRFRPRRRYLRRTRCLRGLLGGSPAPSCPGQRRRPSVQLSERDKKAVRRGPYGERRHHGALGRGRTPGGHAGTAPVRGWPAASMSVGSCSATPTALAKALRNSAIDW